LDRQHLTTRASNVKHNGALEQIRLLTKRRFEPGRRGEGKVTVPVTKQDFLRREHDTTVIKPNAESALLVEALTKFGRHNPSLFVFNGWVPAVPWAFWACPKRPRWTRPWS